MKHKIEIDHEFTVPDELEIIQYHNEMFVMALVFAIPVFGWMLLWLVIIGEWSWTKIRIGRLSLLIIWHKICKFKMSRRLS